MTAPLERLDRTAGPTNVVVFSHPNHELAVFGLLQRLRPRLVYLTDGGGARRVAETVEGLARIGLEGQATFLDHSEASFYTALLAGDAAFFTAVAERVRHGLAAPAPRQVFCDAVEFYNPLHDLALPIVAAALRGSDAALFEVPLVYQEVAAAESYVVQRLPPSRRGAQIALRLDDAELAAKCHARDLGYRMLQRQMGPVVSQLSDTHLATEIVAPAATAPAPPGPDCVLRYEWRAQRLLAQGAIERAITWSAHYRPLASVLFGAGGANC